MNDLKNKFNFQTFEKVFIIQKKKFFRLIFLLKLQVIFFRKLKTNFSLQTILEISKYCFMKENLLFVESV